MKNLVKNVVLIAFFMSFIPVSYAQDDVEEVVVTANKKHCFHYFFYVFYVFEFCTG